MPYYGIGYSDTSMIFLIPALILSAYAQMKVTSTFSKYLKVRSNSGYSGRDIARILLDRAGLNEVSVTSTKGQLTDHYDPRSKVVRLSENVYNGTSIASVSVAAHEVGHAIQHGEGYFPLILRNNLAPIVSFSSNFIWILVILGFIISPFLINVAIILYISIVAFQVITLPVEFNASKRALAELEDGFLPREEIKSSKKVLNAAALTYVAATIVALGQLLRLVSLSNRRRN